MYGLINKAVKDFVVDRFDAETWDSIRVQAGLEDDEFISMEPYPDETTYALVGAASEVLSMSSDDVLEAFGEYWTEYTGVAGYGELMKLGGDSLAEFLSNLDVLHVRVQLAFPELRAPSFKVTESTDERIVVHYYTERSGLAPFAKGLIQGLGRHFDTPVRVTHEWVGSAEDGHEVYEVALVG